MLDFPGSSCLKSAETFFLSHLSTYTPYIRITSPTALASLNLDYEFKLSIVISDRTMDSKLEAARKARFPSYNLILFSLPWKTLKCKIGDCRILCFKAIHTPNAFYHFTNKQKRNLWLIGCPKKQKCEFWYATYPTGFHKLDEPPERFSAL